jgi:hypothetical protein
VSKVTSASAQRRSLPLGIQERHIVEYGLASEHKRMRWRSNPGRFDIVIAQPGAGGDPVEDLHDLGTEAAANGPRRPGPACARWSSAADRSGRAVGGQGLVTKVAIFRQLHSRLVAVLTRRVVSDFGSEMGAARRR